MATPVGSSVFAVFTHLMVWLSLIFNGESDNHPWALMTKTWQPTHQLEKMCVCVCVCVCACVCVSSIFYPVLQPVRPAPAVAEWWHHGRTGQSLPPCVGRALLSSADCGTQRWPHPPRKSRHLVEDMTHGIIYTCRGADTESVCVCVCVCVEGQEGNTRQIKNTTGLQQQNKKEQNRRDT